MIIPLYQAETCHPSIRGRVTALQQFMLGIGALVASWISYGTFIGFADTDSAQWRVALGLQIIPAVALGCLIMLFPEVRRPCATCCALRNISLTFRPVTSLAHRPQPAQRRSPNTSKASRSRKRERCLGPRRIRPNPGEHYL